MPLNLTQTLHDRLWAMLDGYTPFTDAVKAGKYKPLKATTKGYIQSRKSLTDPASLPSLTLDIGTDSATNTNEPVTFNDDPELVDRSIPVRLNVEFVIRHDADTTLTTQTPLESAIRAALQTAGRTLGLSWVSRFTVEGTSRSIETLPSPGGTMASYPTVRFRVVVLGMVRRSLLIAV